MRRLIEGGKNMKRVKMVGKTIIMQSILVLMLTITIFGREIGEFTVQNYL